MPVLAALVLSAHGASMGPQQVGWKDHYFRIHPSARQSAAKAWNKRKLAIEENQAKRKVRSSSAELGGA